MLYFTYIFRLIVLKYVIIRQEEITILGINYTFGLPIFNILQKLVSLF